MNQYSIILLIFYVLLVVVLFLNKNQLSTLSSKDGVILVVAMSMFVVVSIMRNRTYLEKFEQEETTASSAGPTTTSSNSTFTSTPTTTTPTSSQDTHEIPVLGDDPEHQDNIVDKLQLPKQSFACYFSTFQPSSLNLPQKTWHDLTTTMNSHVIHVKHDNVLNIYDQVKGFNLGMSKNEHIELEGFPCSELNLLHGMKQFSVFWFLKFNFSSDDYLEFDPLRNGSYANFTGHSHNLFEMYSTNVKGNIALGIKIYLKKIKRSTNEYDYTETFEINFGGIIHRYEITPTLKVDNKLYFNDDKYHLMTFVKYVDEGKDYIKMMIDNEYEFLTATEINYNQMYFVTNSRNNIVLSRENFVINKRLDGKSMNRNEYQTLKMHLVCFGIINHAIQQSPNNHVSVISKLHEHVSDQIIRLSPAFVANDKQRQEAEGIVNNAKRCVMDQAVCNVCVNVDWSNTSSILDSPACSQAILDRCEKINQENLTVSDEEKALCKSITEFKASIEKKHDEITGKAASDAKCASTHPVDKPKFDNLQAITLDKLNQNKYHKSPSMDHSNIAMKEIDYEKLNDPNYSSQHIIHPMTHEHIERVANNSHSHSQPEDNESINHRHSHQASSNVNKDLSEFDIVSQGIQDNPIHNMTYEELLKVVNAKKRERDSINELKEPHPSVSKEHAERDALKQQLFKSTSSPSTTQHTSSKTNDEDTSLQLSHQNPSEMYDRIMSEYKKDLEMEGLNEELDVGTSLSTTATSGDNSDTSPDNGSMVGRVKSFFGFN